MIDPCSRFLLLRCLVSIILSYELLFGSDSIIGRVFIDTLVIILWLLVPLIALFPAVWLEATWWCCTRHHRFPDGHRTIYLSGNARSDLYIAYFILVLVAASVRRLSHVLTLSLGLSLGYAAVLCQSVIDHGALSVGQVMGVRFPGARHW